jgi:hypothetical protein
MADVGGLPQVVLGDRLEKVVTQGSGDRPPLLNPEQGKSRLHVLSKLKHFHPLLNL